MNWKGFIRKPSWTSRDTVPEFTWWDCGKQRKPQNSWCLDRDSNRKPPEHESSLLPLRQSVRGLFIILAILIIRRRRRIAAVAVTAYSVLHMLPERGRWASKTEKNKVGFEVLTAVVMKSTIFWDISTCSPLSVNRLFGGIYCFHLQGRKNKPNKNPEDGTLQRKIKPVRNSHR
jgi:hypothetical protein